MTSRRRLLIVFGSGLVVTSSGCGAILHSERIGGRHSNQIDWKIAALDGLGLILFFVPGVIAFVVDFYTGAIYLPRHSSRSVAHHGQIDPSQRLPQSEQRLMPEQKAMQDQISQVNPVEQSAVNRSASDLECYQLPNGPLTAKQLEAFLSKHLQQRITLASDQTRVSKLEGLQQFSQQHQVHRENSRFGVSVKHFFTHAKQIAERSRLS